MSIKPTKRLCLFLLSIRMIDKILNLILQYDTAISWLCTPLRNLYISSKLLWILLLLGPAPPGNTNITSALLSLSARCVKEKEEKPSWRLYSTLTEKVGIIVSRASMSLCSRSWVIHNKWNRKLLHGVHSLQLTPSCLLFWHSLTLFVEGASRMEYTEKKLEEMLRCPVCQDIFKDPHQLPCGHSMCMGCLENMRDHSSDMPFRCPDCRRFFGFAIGLQKSYTLTNITENFRESKKRKVRCRLKQN